MKTEPKQEAISKVSIYKNMNPSPQTFENQRTLDQQDVRYFLPKIGQTFLNISANVTKFQDSKFPKKSFPRINWRKFLQDENWRK